MCPVFKSRGNGKVLAWHAAGSRQTPWVGGIPEEQPQLKAPLLGRTPSLPPFGRSHVLPGLEAPQTGKEGLALSQCGLNSATLDPAHCRRVVLVC